MATALELELEAPGAIAPETSIVRVVQFPQVWGRNVSPFGLKLETWLRLAGIPFVVQPSTKLHKAPKGKLPYIHDGPHLIADSTLIIEHLKRTRRIDPDAALTGRQQAEAVALQRLFEDHLYFIMAYSRWLDPEGAPTVLRSFLASLPAPMRGAAGALMRGRVRRMLQAQGLGRHEPHEIYEFARVDLEAVAAYLGDKSFFMGEQLTTVDAVAFGFLANIVLVPIETELKRIAAGFPNLVAWCEAMEQGLYAGGSPG
jgi:glutathione S-transferase